MNSTNLSTTPTSWFGMAAALLFVSDPWHGSSFTFVSKIVLHELYISACIFQRPLGRAHLLFAQGSTSAVVSVCQMSSAALG